MKHLAAAILLSLSAMGSLAAAPPPDIKPGAATTWLKSTPAVQILDVRTKEEYAKGYIDKSRLIPWTDKDFKTRATKEIDPAKPVLVYCHSGGRSADAAAELVKLGYKDVRNLEGGIVEWRKAANPVVKPK
jgi:rhodanese-related sulfurtransferase